MAIKPPQPIKSAPTVISLPTSRVQKRESERSSSHEDSVRLADIIDAAKTSRPKADFYRDGPPRLRSARDDASIASVHRDLSLIKDPVLRGLMKDVLDSWDAGGKEEAEALVGALLGKKAK